MDGNGHRTAANRAILDGGIRTCFGIDRNGEDLSALRASHLDVFDQVHPRVLIGTSPSPIWGSAQITPHGGRRSRDFPIRKAPVFPCEKDARSRRHNRGSPTGWPGIRPPERGRRSYFSRTCSRIAEAMALSWGSELPEQITKKSVKLEMPCMSSITGFSAFLSAAASAQARASVSLSIIAVESKLGDHVAGRVRHHIPHGQAAGNAIADFRRGNLDMALDHGEI